MATYKKRPESDTWHWEKDCSNYPTKKNAATKTTKPTSGEKCNECKAKSRRKK